MRWHAIPCNEIEKKHNTMYWGLDPRSLRWGSVYIILLLGISQNTFLHPGSGGSEAAGKGVCKSWSRCDPDFHFLLHGWLGDWQIRSSQNMFIHLIWRRLALLRRMTLQSCLASRSTQPLVRLQKRFPRNMEPSSAAESHRPRPMSPQSEKIYQIQTIDS